MQVGDRIQWPQPEIPLGGTVRGIDGNGRLDILWDDGTRTISTEGDLAALRGEGEIEEAQAPSKPKPRRPRRPRVSPS